MKVMKKLTRTQNYWKEAIINGISCFFIYGVKPDEYGEPILEQVEEGDKIYEFPKIKKMYQRIPVLCFDEFMSPFQIIVDTEFETICMGQIENLTIKNFSIPNKYAHMSDSDVIKLYPLVDEVIERLNEKFKTCVFEYGCDYIDDVV